MRISLFVLGVSAAIVCIQQRAQAEQAYPWFIYKPDTPPNNAWPIGLAKAGPVHPVRTHPRRNQLSQRGPGRAKRFTACAKAPRASFLLPNDVKGLGAALINSQRPRNLAASG
jgi:hypothetical protein